MKEKNNKFGEIKRDFKEAFESFQSASIKGDSEAMVEYGLFFEYGYGVVNIDLKKAQKCYKNSYEKGNPSGYAYYGYSLIDDKFGSHSQKEQNDGLNLIQYAINKNNPSGFLLYGCLLLRRKCGLKFNQTKVLLYMRKAALLGSTAAIRNLGYFYFDGFAVKADHEVAYKYLKISLEEGKMSAAYYLAHLCYSKDFNEFLKLMEIAADHDNYHAIYEFCLNYAKENFDKEEEKNKLLHYLNRGVELRIPSVIFLFGCILYLGFGLPANKKEGIKFIKMSSKMNYNSFYQMHKSKKEADFLNEIKNHLSEIKQNYLNDVNKIHFYQSFLPTDHLIDKEIYDNINEKYLYIINNAEEGNFYCLDMAVNYFYYGKNSFPKKIDLVDKYLKLAVENSFDENCNDVSDDIFTRLFELGVNTENKYIIRMYAGFYFNGRFTEKDVKIGLKLYKMAADLGDTEAMLEYNRLKSKYSFLSII